MSKKKNLYSQREVELLKWQSKHQTLVKLKEHIEKEIKHAFLQISEWQERVDDEVGFIEPL